MIARLAALILLGTLSPTQGVSDPMPLTVAAVGDKVTFICSVAEMKIGLFYWYKINLGYMVQTVAAGTSTSITLDAQFHNSRFNVTKEGDQYLLSIRNVTKEDEATYFCQGGEVYIMKIINGTLLAVNDPNLQKLVYVEQTPETASVASGGSVTLQCSLQSKNKDRDQCPGGCSMYWFRAGSGELNPGVIYTHQNRRDEQEERSCVYSISKTIQDSSDDGTYYCAVVTCGHILFGEGTKVETRQQLWPLIIVIFLLLAFCIIVIVTLVFIRKREPVKEHCKGEAIIFTQADQGRSDENQLNYGNGETGPLNYVALDFPSRKARRWRNKMESPEESLYTFTRE